MPKKAEITYSIQNDHPSITIHLSEEGDLTPDLRGMLSQIQEAITEFQAKPQTRQLSSSDVKVQDISRSSPSAREEPSPDNRRKSSYQNNASSGNEVFDKSSPGSITKRQIGMIYFELKNRNIPEQVFCAKNGVARVEDLPWNTAWDIINKKLY